MVLPITREELKKPAEKHAAVWLKDQEVEESWKSTINRNTQGKLFALV